MQQSQLLDVEVDLCPHCEGVFLDPGEAEAQGIDTAALFGARAGSARGGAPSERKCPAHGRPMLSYAIDTAGGVIEIERSACCGGVYLDAGEHAGLAQAARHAAAFGDALGRDSGAGGDESAESGVIRTASGTVFAAPPHLAAPKQAGDPNYRQAAFATVCRGVVATATAAAKPSRAWTATELAASQPTGRTCPRCGGAYRAARASRVEIDTCPSCGSMFLDLGEADVENIHTAALFGAGPEAARAVGPSELSCPACQKAMTAYVVTWLTGEIEVDRAECCGGLFLDGGEHDPVRRAARRALSLDADRAFAEGGYVVDEKAMNRALAEGDGLNQAMLSTIRGSVDGMMLQMMRDARRRSRGRRGYQF